MRRLVQRVRRYGRNPGITPRGRKSRLSFCPIPGCDVCCNVPEQRLLVVQESFMTPAPPLQRSFPTGGRDFLPASCRAFLDQLVGWGLLDAVDRETFLVEKIDRLREYATQELLTQALVRAGLLTSFQMDRLRVGTAHGLILGEYRVREEGFLSAQPKFREFSAVTE